MCERETNTKIIIIIMNAKLTRMELKLELSNSEAEPSDSRV